MSYTNDTKPQLGTFYLLKQDGGYLLKQDGGKIILSQSVTYTDDTKPTVATWTNDSK